MIDNFRKLWDHISWADQRILDALQSAPERVEIRSSADSESTEILGADNLTRSHYTDARREFAHIIGAEENWLARLEQRTPRAAIWPDLSPSALEQLTEEVHRGFGDYLEGLAPAGLAEKITYLNSKGHEFTNEVGDILLHVALHGQYHRGKINLLLRLAGETPAPTDYIAFVRGVPAATTADPSR